MNQHNIGIFIGTKRREKNLTQEQLAEKLGISKALCKELGIILSELLDGEEKEPNSIRVYDEDQVKSLLCKMRKMEKTYIYSIGAMMVIVGLISLFLVTLFGGSNFQDFVSGCLFGMGIGMISVGIVAIIMSLKE